MNVLKLYQSESDMIASTAVDKRHCLLIDGMAVVQSLVEQPWVKTCSDLAILFNNKIEFFVKESEYTDVRLIFDSYYPDSLKEATRTKRNAMCRSIYYHVEDSTNIASLTFKEFLSNQSTKKELTIYLATKYFSSVFKSSCRILCCC